VPLSVCTQQRSKRQSPYISCVFKITLHKMLIVLIYLMDQPRRARTILAMSMCAAAFFIMH
jgi:hypothetical protein